MENMILEQIKNTMEQVRQRNQINTINEVNETEKETW